MIRTPRAPMDNGLRGLLILLVLAAMIALQGWSIAQSAIYTGASPGQSLGWLLLVCTTLGAAAWGFQAALWDYEQGPLPGS